MESPVCTPMGSRFSMEHTMMQLSFLSRTTSISNSFQPSRDSSSSTSVVGDKSRPCATMALNSSRLRAIPPPLPPSVNEGRTTIGKPSAGCCSRASSRLCASDELADCNPISSMAFRNSSRSSARSMARLSAPIMVTECCPSTPSRSRSRAQFRAVCPPIVGSSASGRSLSITPATVCQRMGSI